MDDHKVKNTPSSSKSNCTKCHKAFKNAYHCQRHMETCSSSSVGKGGRPCTNEIPAKRSVRRQTKKKLDFINEDPVLKENIVNRITKQENVCSKEMTEDDAIALITDIEISYRKAIQMFRKLKLSFGKGIVISNLKNALISRKKYFQN